MTTTSLQTTKPAESPVNFDPSNMGELLQLATMLAQSQLVPAALRGKPQDIVIVGLTGRDLGLSLMQSMRMLHVIEGKPVMSADLIVARCLQSSACEYFRLIKSGDDEAVYETKRKGMPAPVQIGYSYEDATKAGLVNKDNWKKNRRDMLRRRAASRLGRDCYPDMVGGLYDPDEGEEIRAAELVDDGSKRPTTLEGLKEHMKASLAEGVLPDLSKTNPVAEGAILPTKDGGIHVALFDPAVDLETISGGSPFADDPATPPTEPQAAILDPADSTAFAHRLRFPERLAEPWDEWAGTYPWKGMLGPYTPAEAIQGSWKGKRHAGLSSAVEWQQTKGNPKDVKRGALIADYCLAYLEEANKEKLP